MTKVAANGRPTDRPSVPRGQLRFAPLSSLRAPSLLSRCGAAAWPAHRRRGHPPPPRRLALAPVLLDYIKESHDERRRRPVRLLAGRRLAGGGRGDALAEPTMLPLLNGCTTSSSSATLRSTCAAARTYQPRTSRAGSARADRPGGRRGARRMRARDEDEYEFDLAAWARWTCRRALRVLRRHRAQGNTQYDGSRVEVHPPGSAKRSATTSRRGSATSTAPSRACTRRSPRIIADIERPETSTSSRRRRAIRRAILGAQLSARNPPTPPPSLRAAAAERRLPDEPGAIDSLRYVMSCTRCARCAAPRRVQLPGRGRRRAADHRQVTSAPLLPGRGPARGAGAARRPGRDDLRLEDAAARATTPHHELRAVQPVPARQGGRARRLVGAAGPSRDARPRRRLRRRGRPTRCTTCGWRPSSPPPPSLASRQDVEHFRQLEGGVPPRPAQHVQGRLRRRS